MSPDQLWNAALGELELELSKANFITWFKDTFILQSGEGKITIGVPNDFTKKWFEGKYHHSILKALRRISDDDIRTVVYTIATRKNSSQLQQAISASQTATSPVESGNTTAAAEQKTKINQNNTSIKTATPTPNSDGNTLPPIDAVGLNPRYTFEHFIVGKKNELAHAACLAIAERPGIVYNPLFIYGGVGLGKTHLMQAVGHAVLKRDPNKKILYVTCEAFTNEFIKAVQDGRAKEFKDKYRSVDVLMVDDIQFLAGKEGTQEEFFHTFNHLHQYNKQVLVSSDRPPRAIPTLEPRLFSRLEAGMMVDVNIPDLETRIAILKQKCAERGYTLNPEITQFMASNVQSNIRELEGALNRVVAFHQLHKTEPTLDSVRSLLSTLSQSPKRGAITTKKILNTVAEFYEVDMKDIVGNSRKKELVVPRQIAMYLMREEIHASYPNIGQELGGRDHTTAMHACQKITKMVHDDERIENDVNMIKQRLYN
ncbi:MAG: chromosomal replication initiator protein DnaA [Candidatus Kerfeldbacteria bacterium]|nr:chromosomal replication initiator protein DnaA [Candidatus Kerfeldbacteria bacterium]